MANTQAQGSDGGPHPSPSDAGTPAAHPGNVAAAGAPELTTSHGRTVEIWPLIDGEFPDIRDQDVTASMVSCLGGASRFTSHWQYWMEKSGRLALPKTKRHMRRGLRFEEAIALESAEEFKLNIHKAGVYLRDPEWRIGATPDWVVVTDTEVGVPAEIKMVNFRSWVQHWGEGADAPLDYQLQLQVQMALTGADHGMILALVAGDQLVKFDYEYRPGVYAVVAGQVEEFWRSIAAGDEPQVDVESIKPELIVRAYGKAKKGTSIDLTADNRISDLCETLLWAEQAVKATKEELAPYEDIVKGAKAAILAKIKLAENADSRQFTITTKTKERKAYTAEASAWREIKVERKEA